jgi:thiamine pyrophosphokinase
LRALFEREKAPDRWVTAREDIRLVRPGARLDLDAGRGGIVSVFPLMGEGAWEAESAGLKWPLEGLAWEAGSAYISNVAVDGPFTVRSLSGRFMVITSIINR